MKAGLLPLWRRIALARPGGDLRARELAGAVALPAILAADPVPMFRRFALCISRRFSPSARSVLIGTESGIATAIASTLRILTLIPAFPVLPVAVPWFVRWRGFAFGLSTGRPAMANRKGGGWLAAIGGSGAAKRAA